MPFDHLFLVLGVLAGRIEGMEELEGFIGLEVVRCT